MEIPRFGRGRSTTESTPPTLSHEEFLNARERAARTGGAPEAPPVGATDATPPTVEAETATPDPSEAPTEVLDPATPIETLDPDFHEKFKQSREDYARLRVRERIKTGWNPRQTGELSPDLAKARTDYEEQLREYATDLIDQRAAERDAAGELKYTDVEVAHEAALIVYEEMAKLADREAELNEAKGPKYKEVYTKLKHNRKARFAIGVGLAGVSMGVGIATGGTGFLVAAGAAKIGWRSLSGYMGGEGLQGLHQGRKTRKTLGKEVAAFNADPASLSQEQQEALSAKLSSPELAGHLGAEQVTQAREGILQTSVDQLADRVFNELQGLHGERILKSVDVIKAELTRYLDLQDKQIQADRKALQARRLSGLAGAVVLGGAGPLIEQITHWTGHAAGGGGAHEGAQAHTTATTVPSPTEAATAHQPVEIHDPSYYNPDATTGADHYGAHGVAVAEMRPGEDPHDMAAHILSRFKGWHNFDQAERHVKIAHLAEQLAAEQHHAVGDKVRWTYEQAAGSYHFNPAEHLSNSTPAGTDAHFGPSPTNHSVDMGNLSPTHGVSGGEVSHTVGSTGGTGVGPEHANHLFENSTNPKFPSFNYNSNGFAEMQIAKPTQPKQLAEYVLSQFDGWKSFSAGQQNLKVAHFANELATQNFRVGSRVKWAYDFARGCFNYNG